MLRDVTADGRGRVGTEWRFRVAPPGEIVRPLVPDVAFLDYAALPRDAAPADFEVPLGSPTVAVEILSPDDRPRDVADKVATYLAAGSSAVLIVDPKTETLTIHQRDGKNVLGAGDRFTHWAMPGYDLDIAALFERARH